jgi:hypothetical protein
MKTKTELLLEYTKLSWDHDFPPDIETALENDYVANPHLYSESVFKEVALLLLVLAPDAPSECVLDTVRRCGSAC